MFDIEEFFGSMNCDNPPSSDLELNIFLDVSIRGGGPRFHFDNFNRFMKHYYFKCAMQEFYFISNTANDQVTSLLASSPSLNNIKLRSTVMKTFAIYEEGIKGR